MVHIPCLFFHLLYLSYKFIYIMISRPLANQATIEQNRRKTIRTESAKIARQLIERYLQDQNHKLKYQKQYKSARLSKRKKEPFQQIERESAKEIKVSYHQIKQQSDKHQSKALKLAKQEMQALQRVNQMLKKVNSDWIDQDFKDLAKIIDLKQIASDYMLYHIQDQTACRYLFQISSQPKANWKELWKHENQPEASEYLDEHQNQIQQIEDQRQIQDNLYIQQTIPFRINQNDFEQPWPQFDGFSIPSEESEEVQFMQQFRNDPHFENSNQMNQIQIANWRQTQDSFHYQHSIPFRTIQNDFEFQLDTPSREVQSMQQFQQNSHFGNSNQIMHQADSQNPSLGELNRIRGQSDFKKQEWQLEYNSLFG